MKKINLSIACFTALTLIGCGAGGSIESNTNNTAGNDTVSTSKIVTVERGPVLLATVKDANNQIAKNIDNTKLNTYVFDTIPTYPITVTAGYIDVNNDNIIDTNDIKHDITMTSYSNIVSPLTTFIGNDSTKLDFLKTTYGLTTSQIKNSLPSTVSNKTVILSNAIYKLLVNTTPLTTTNLSTEYSTVETVFNTSFSSFSDLKTLSSDLEDNTLTVLTKAKLTNLDVSTANQEFWGDRYIDSLTLTNSTFTKNKTTSTNVSDIWNIGLDIPANQSVSDFDIAVNIVKSSSGTIGNIVIEGISIANNSLTAANKVSIFGKKTSGSTSSIAYDSTKNITKNAVALVQGKLLIDLGYIIKNQDVVSESSFTNASDYAVTVYVTKLDTSNTAITSNTSVQTTASTSLTIPSGSQKITGTISVVGAN